MNKERFLKSLSNFCKRRKTTGMRLDDLYEAYGGREKDITRNDFELGLFALKKETVMGLMDTCRRYNKESPYGYSKFIRERQPITMELWRCLLGLRIASEIKAEDIVQPPFEDIARTIEEIKEDLPAETEIWSQQGTVTDKRNKAPSAPAVMDPDTYAEFLPLDWGSMNLSARIDFVKDIHEPGFHDYVIESDERIKKYFAQAQAKTRTRDSIKMCRTIFTTSLDDCTPKARNLAKDIVDSLNKVAGISLEYLECSNSKTLEIRQVLR
jgi:hypothetical protein